MIHTHTPVVGRRSILSRQHNSVDGVLDAGETIPAAGGHTDSDGEWEEGAVVVVGSSQDMIFNAFMRFLETIHWFPWRPISI
jgi:hypothetical protein